MLTCCYSPLQFEDSIRSLCGELLKNDYPLRKLRNIHSNPQLITCSNCLVLIDKLLELNLITANYMRVAKAPMIFFFRRNLNDNNKSYNELLQTITEFRNELIDYAGTRSEGTPTNDVNRSSD